MIESRFKCPRCGFYSPWRASAGPFQHEAKAAKMVGGRVEVDRCLIYELCATCYERVRLFLESNRYDHVLPRARPDAPPTPEPKKKRSTKKR
ncbi:MAG: hypothetical protein WCG85_12550 [Polyangia bacterium]